MKTPTNQQELKQTKSTADDEVLFTSLRAGSWDEFAGQPKTKDQLRIAIDAARKRGEAIEHVLLYGPPGLGKTTLAHIIGREMGVNIRVTSGPAIERAGDLASILTNLEPKDVLFIDEIHRLNKVVEETLYPAMEDYCLDIVVGTGPSARTVRLDLPHFTIVGATTRIGLLSSPMRDRFGVISRLHFYQPDELETILDRAAAKLRMPISPTARQELARRSRGTPRIALRLLKRVRDVAEIAEKDHISDEILERSLRMLDVDNMGLDDSDRRLVRIIMEKFAGGPVGIDTLAAALSEDVGTLEDVIEPYLIQIGFLKRTPRGRMLTRSAYHHFGKPVPAHLKEEIRQEPLIRG